MAKKKKYSNDFRKMGNVILGGGMASSMMPLMSNPSTVNLDNATQGMVGFAVLGATSGVAFNAIDNIYKSGKKHKRKVYK